MRASCLIYRISIYSEDEISGILRYTIQFLLVIVEMEKKLRMDIRIMRLLLEHHLRLCLR
jgi:hypothetical protein